MCINYQTSIIAFIIGELAGLGLINTDNQAKKALGIFVIFYTFVQFFEIFIHKFGNNATDIYSRLLLLDLGLQGLIFFLCMSKIYAIKYIYITLTALIALYILFRSTQNTFKKATIDNDCNKCLRWNFIDNNLFIALFTMYTIMFY